MQTHTNKRLAVRRGRIGRVSTLLGFACLIGGLILSWQNNELVLVAWATLLPGFLLISYGNYNTIRWGVKPRVDEILATVLKTLDHKYQLYNYVEGLPVDHVLLTPSGLVVIETRPYLGEFVNSGRKWRRRRNLLGLLMAFGEGNLGNPTRDAERGAAAMQEYLADRLGAETAAQVPVDAVVVFTHPRAKLSIEDPDVPVVPARELKPVVRKPQANGRLSSNLYRQVAQALGGGR